MKNYLFYFTLFIATHLSGQINLTKPFSDCGVAGSITIYDYKAKKWIFSDKADSEVTSLPASTFKIMNTLILLESGIIKDENEIIKWTGNQDTAKYGYRPEIYHDMNLKEAFKLSAGWVYVKLSEQLGKQTYHDLLIQSHYGNGDLSNMDTDFWNFGNFGVTPVNQVEVLIGVYEETLPFSSRSFQLLKEMMVVEKNNDYTLRAKTGWARDGGKDTGWWIGYVERKDNVYFFATRLSKNRGTRNPDFANCRKEVTINILKQLNILEEN